MRKRKKTQKIEGSTRKKKEREKKGEKEGTKKSIMNRHIEEQNVHEKFPVKRD